MKLLKLMKGQPKYVQHETEDGCEDCWYWFACNRWWWGYFVFHVVNLNWVLMASCVELMYITYLFKQNKMCADVCCCRFIVYIYVPDEAAKVTKYPIQRANNVIKVQNKFDDEEKRKWRQKKKKRREIRKWKMKNKSTNEHIQVWMNRWMVEYIYICVH